MTNPLVGFHPIVRKWFEATFGSLTRAQELAWPRIAEGKNVLVTAPTGSGKTLTAFLSAIDLLVRGTWPLGKVRVLYVSPLRALNNDIRANLTRPLQELNSRFAAQGEPFPPIRAMTRSGDTSQADRRKMLRTPPEILITTPESLNILLTSKKGCDLLRHLETVILDEVHAVAASKRGTHLITAVERLTRLSGEFQRIALSATVRPLETIARWVGGAAPGPSANASRIDRPVEIIDAAGEKKYDVAVCHAKEIRERPDTADAKGSPVWFNVADEVAKQIEAGDSTLVFANSRRGVERLARLINAEREERLVYSHHGSLSREIREVVEERLKKGELRGIVATNSLELGIDVGAVNQVLLVETPPSISSTVQRIGRAGHGVGQTSKAKIYPLHPQDYLDAAVAMEGLTEGEVEPLEVPSGPLDVLAQVILSMTSTETWRVDALFDFLRCASPYRDLKRPLFDRVVEMLAGKYEGSKVPELKPRVSLDRVSGTIAARPHVARLLYASGGTIADRGYYTLRIAENGAPVGELDEEFVFERVVGETISLGVQSWKINRIGLNDVFVTPSGSRAAMAPFWRCEERFHDFFYATRRAAFLERTDATLDDPALVQTLQNEHHFTEDAAARLIEYLVAQKEATNCSLPHRYHVVVEEVAYPRSTGMRPFTVLHTPFGGLVNRPFALALKAGIRKNWGTPVEVMYEDGCVALELPESPSMTEILELIPTGDLADLIRSELESTGFFGAHFRENAARSLLLLKAGFKKRTPLWLHRQRAKELMESVAKYADFPVLLETWRSCMQDEVDLAHLKLCIDEMKSGAIAVTHVRTTAPSPFASEVLWKRTNELMYEDDVPTVGKTALREDLIKEVVYSAALRPRISMDVIDALMQKLHRTYPGYSPRSAGDLIEFVKERVFIPEDEWKRLGGAMNRDWRLSLEEIVPEVEHRLVGIALGADPSNRVVVSVEMVQRIRDAFGFAKGAPLLSVALDGSPAGLEATEAVAKIATLETGDHAVGSTQQSELVSEWLAYYGPESVASLHPRLGIDASSLLGALAVLEDERRVVIDEITEDATGAEVIDSVNLARLLRMTRKRHRPAVTARPLSELGLFLADLHRFGSAGSVESLESALENLFGYAAAPHLFEEEFLPARLQSYQPNWLDSLFTQSELLWCGAGDRALLFCLAPDRELIAANGGDEEDESDLSKSDALFPSGPGRYTLMDLSDHGATQAVRTVATALWELSWAGRVTNDTFESVRQGIDAGFKRDVSTAGEGRRHRRSRLSKWSTRARSAGNWYRLPAIPKQVDAVESEELNKDRVRLLLDRYGILFRELLLREIGPMKWGALFRTLRLMELSGEVMAGQFFEGIHGIQFISTEAFQRLQSELPTDLIYWMNAKDPISLCGLRLDGLQLPNRVSRTHLVFRGTDLGLVSMRTGKRLEFRVDPDDPSLSEFLAPLDHLLTRQVNPLRSITIEEINGVSAATSPFCDVFETRFDAHPDHRSITIHRRY